MRTIHDLGNKTVEINEEHTVGVVRKKSTPAGLGGILRAEAAEFVWINVQKRYLEEFLDELDSEIIRVGLDKKQNALYLANEDESVKIYVMKLTGAADTEEAF
jgi:hypothetical protein